MALPNGHEALTPVGHAASDRLDTWKEVAAHLRRSVRTVQRWEREEGLPVHRHRHDKLGSIYAFKDELDAWWDARGAALQDADDHSGKHVAAATSAKPVRRSAGPDRWKIAAVLALGAGLAAIGVNRFVSPTNAENRAAGSAHEPHRLLITDFENLTDDRAISARLRDALQEQLSTSRFANVVPMDQVADVLRLMKKPADTLTDASVGREICRRDGTIDAFVTGLVDKVGSNYVATVRVLTPQNAIVAASFVVREPSQGQLLEGVRREIVRVQRTIDEQLPHSPRRTEVPKVTTTSLRALDLYSRAVELMDQVPVKADPAFALLTEAIGADSEFASAHILAAWALRNGGRGKDEYLPYAERAFALVNETTEAERYFILGSYYQLKLDIEKAISAYEALLRLNPKHYWALGNLGRLYRAVGRHAAASELRARQVDIRPRQFWGPYRMAEALLLKGDLEGAKHYAATAIDLMSQVDSGELQSRRSWFEVLPACAAWLHDDVSESARIAQALERTLSERAAADRIALTTTLGYWYLALGQRRASERMFSRLPDAEGRFYHLAILSSQYGESDQTRKYISAVAASTHPAAFTFGLPTLDAAALPIAEALVTNWSKRVDEPDAKLLHGQLALMQGRPQKARALLEESIAVREDRFSAPALSASIGVATAWKSSGNRDQAIHVLEEASQNRFRSCLWPTASAHLWVRIRGELAGLYRKVGRDAEANAIEAQLRNLLRDADYPPVARLNPVHSAPVLAASPH